ncbi:MAG TPA: ATP-dependent DNA helicase [Candidatus Levybacteria bacterium]|nr:ATP-dependent DNA helicase [Candidatus Levybacteria bacterium]
MNPPKLNPEQKKAVYHGDGPLLIIAGAGTGKTTVITERIKHLISDKKLDPGEILALTFTEKAATEMEERVDRIMPYGYSQLWISTFHSFCDTILREEGIHIGLNPNYKLMTESDSVIFLKKQLFSLKLNYFRPLGNPNKFIEAMLQHFARLQDEDISPTEYLKWAKAQNSKLKIQNDEDKEEAEKNLELANAYSHYTEMKLKEGMLDFSDIIAQTLVLFRTRKNILKKYQDQFKFLLIDEFQDTNFAQNTLALLLAGKKQNITVVADDDQAIYRWRGAALSNVIQFRTNYPNTTITTLTRNYRSTQEILDRAYIMIQNNNPNRLEVLEQINKKLTSNRKDNGLPIEFLYTTRVDEEAEIIVRKIQELEKDGLYTYADMAILVRANNHAQPITQALQRLRIPYQFLGPAQLFQRDEIKDLIAYLRSLANLEDTVSLFRVLQMNVFNLSMRDITFLLQFARKKNISFFEALERSDESPISDDAKTKIAKIHTMIVRHIERSKVDSAGQILYYFLTDTGLFEKFIEYKTQAEEQIAQNIARFFDKIKTYETLNREATLYSTVEWIDLMMEMGDSPLVQEVDWKDFNAVKILTVHSSKGLEFPVVFLINLVMDRFPSRARKETLPIPDNLVKEVLPTGDFHIQEERRLFYVGMTRAKDRLYFTASKFYAEGKREKKLSPFIYEALPEELLRQGEKHTPTQLTLLEATKDYTQMPTTVDSPLAEPLKIHAVSFSQLQAFDICPLHFKARYLLNIPTPNTAPLSFGSSIHDTLRNLHELSMQKKAISQDEFLKLLRKNWRSEGYMSKPYEKEMFAKGEKILKLYFKQYYNPSNPPLALEQPFSFFINKNDDPTEKPIKVSGFIDRIDQRPDGGIEIIDYKTGKPEKLSKRSYQLQLGLYALAATQVKNEFLGKKPEEITVSLLYLETGNMMSQQITQDDIEYTQKAIQTKIQEIESSDFKCSKSILCQNCEYKMLCNA